MCVIPYDDVHWKWNVCVDALCNATQSVDVLKKPTPHHQTVLVSGSHVSQSPLAYATELHKMYIGVQ